jgi:tRNA(Ile)-lysidine synthase TilS/MesJ
MSYEALLMLSGGKDSCALAFDLKKQGINFLCFTLDNSFLSDMAKSNIEKLTRILDLDNVVIKPKPSLYEGVINLNESLLKTCTICSYKTLISAISVCKQFGITTIYAGFTIITAKAQGWSLESESMVDGILIKNPYKKEYDFKKIKTLLIQHGLEYDPAKTNCKHIQELIGRDIDNCFEKEIELMHKEGQIDDGERDYYSGFIKSCRVR